MDKTNADEAIAVTVGRTSGRSAGCLDWLQSLPAHIASEKRQATTLSAV
jgi:hypothetical protein